jgi:hypothetical protein
MKLKATVRTLLLVILFTVSIFSGINTVIAAAPSATNLSAAETYTEDISLNLIDIVASDADGGSLTATLTLSNLSAGSLTTATSGVTTSTYNPATGVWAAVGPIAEINVLLAAVSFIPAPDFNSDFFINTRVEDGSASANGTKFFTGVATNDAPVLDGTRSPTMVTVGEDASVPTGAVGTLVSSLVDFTIPAGGLDNVSDVDSSPSTGIAVTATNSSLTCYYSINSGSTWSPIGAVSSSSSRLLSANVTNRIYCRAGAGTFGTFSDAITLRAWDQTTGVNGSTTDTTTSGGTTAFSTTTDTAALTITSAGNHAPVAVDDEYTVDQNSPGVALAVMGNDTDPDNDTFTITDVSTPDQGGNAQNILSGTEIGYTPAPGFCGDEQFTYEISDGNGGIDQATVTVHVVNCDTATDAPTLVSPATGTTYYNNVLLPITFTLPETLLHNSLRLIFTSSLETSFVLNLRDAAPGTNTFNVDPRGNIDQLIEVLSTTSNSIPVETYTVTISYQDVYGNTAASATSTNVTIADPVVISAPSSGSGYNPALAWNPATVSILTDKKTCPANQVLTQNLKSGSRNGKYNSYTRGIVTEAKILQAHLNRLGFSSGIEDGILGPKSDSAIKKLQKSLGVKADGYVGSATRNVINNSCK